MSTQIAEYSEVDYRPQRGRNAFGHLDNSKEPIGSNANSSNAAHKANREKRLYSDPTINAVQETLAEDEAPSETLLLAPPVENLIPDELVNAGERLDSIRNQRQEFYDGYQEEHFSRPPLKPGPGLNAYRRNIFRKVIKSAPPGTFTEGDRELLNSYTDTCYIYRLTRKRAQLMGCFRSRPPLCKDGSFDLHVISARGKATADLHKASLNMRAFNDRIRSIIDNKRKELLAIQKEMLAFKTNDPSTRYSAALDRAHQKINKLRQPSLHASKRYLKEKEQEEHQAQLRGRVNETKKVISTIEDSIDKIMEKCLE